MFVESGSIRYGDAGKVSFKTVGAGPAAVGFFGQAGEEVIVGPLTDVRNFSSSATSVHVDTRLLLGSGLPGSVSTPGFDVTFSQSVPEPSVVLLLVSGAGLVAVMARRRSQREGRHCSRP